MLTGGKYIFRYFYKISLIRISKTGHKKINQYFTLETIRVIQTEKLIQFVL